MSRADAPQDDPCVPEKSADPPHAPLTLSPARASEPRAERASLPQPPPDPRWKTVTDPPRV